MTIKESIKSNIANAVTASRVVFAALLLFTPAFSVLFYALYLLGGVTDMVDGTIARAFHQKTPFGAKLDTVADLLFVVAVLIKVIPNVSFPLWLWAWIAVIGSIKLLNLISGFVVCRRMVAVHSTMNKVTGIMLFVLPLTVGLPWKALAAECILTCFVATFAAVQEGQYIQAGIERE